jgi:hypothetical protein
LSGTGAKSLERPSVTIACWLCSTGSSIRPRGLILAALGSSQTFGAIPFAHCKSARRASSTDHVGGGTLSLARDARLCEVLITDDLVQAGGGIILTQPQLRAELPVLRIQLLCIHT